MLLPMCESMCTLRRGSHIWKAEFGGKGAGHLDTGQLYCCTLCWMGLCSHVTICGLHRIVSDMMVRHDCVSQLEVKKQTIGACGRQEACHDGSTV